MRAAASTIRAEPNVTPMIDVMLVLLIVFMTVAPILAEGFRAEPPRGTHLAAHPDADADVVIGVDAWGRYYLNRSPVSEAALRTALRGRFDGRAIDRIAYVRADSGLAFAAVQVALDIAGRSGARVVGLVTEAPVPRGARGAP